MLIFLGLNETVLIVFASVIAAIIIGILLRDIGFHTRERSRIKVTNLRSHLMHEAGGDE